MGGGRADWLKSSETWRNAGAVGALLLLTLAVAAAYVARPQSPRDFLDRLALVAGGPAYGPNLRQAEQSLRMAVRAEAEGDESRTIVLEWQAVRNFAAASAAAPGARERMLANDRLADVYLSLGRRYLAQGRGQRFGLGRDEARLKAAEDVAACVVGLAPTRRRGQIDTFVGEVEDVLHRPLEGRCRR